MKWTTLERGLTSLAMAMATMVAMTKAQAADKKPNIVVIWGDDVGIHNISAYNLGLMGYKFQQGSSLNAAGINYSSLQAMEAMKRLHQLETIPAPRN